MRSIKSNVGPGLINTTSLKKKSLHTSRFIKTLQRRPSSAATAFAVRFPIMTTRIGAVNNIRAISSTPPKAASCYFEWNWREVSIAMATVSRTHIAPVTSHACLVTSITVSAARTTTGRHWLRRRLGSGFEGWLGSWIQGWLSTLLSS
mmetsp:Transcript_4854/g.9595  ORF Transcript_4854/g.9595 Transcript_4854/m.9595 type:complete len:148 (+) Transcript_4854:24-467(+)